MIERTGLQLGDTIIDVLTLEPTLYIIIDLQTVEPTIDTIIDLQTLEPTIDIIIDVKTLEPTLDTIVYLQNLQTQGPAVLAGTITKKDGGVILDIKTCLVFIKSIYTISVNT